MMKKIDLSIMSYRKVGIEIEILDNFNIPWTVKTKQTSLLNGYILNQKELVERTKAVFEDNEIHVIPVTYSLPLKNITSLWITEQMKLYKVSKKDLLKQLGIGKNEIDQILKGHKIINNAEKAAFFYYFLTHQINTEMRNLD